MNGQQKKCFKVLGQHVPEFATVSDTVFLTDSSKEESDPNETYASPGEDISASQCLISYAELNTAEDQEVAEDQKKHLEGCSGIIDPMEIKLNRNLRRPTTESRLRKFERSQEKKKRRKLTERQMRAIASKRRAEKTKAEVLLILEWYFINKLADNRMRVFEAEKLKHGRQKMDEKKKLEEEGQEIRKNIEKSIQNRLSKEITSQSRMKKELFEHEVLQAAEAIEVHLKDKFQDMLKLNLCELRDNYQNLMDDYCVFWKKKAYHFNDKIEKIKFETNRSVQFYEDQKTLEWLLNVETKWRKRAKESWKKNVQLMKSFLEIVIPKEEELKNIQEENEKLQRSIGQWEDILPSIADQMKQFVKLTINKNTPGRENLLKTLNKLYEFTDVLPEKVGNPRKESIVKDVLDDIDIFNEDEFPNDEGYKSLDFKDYLILKIKQSFLDSIKIVRNTSPIRRKAESVRKTRESRKQSKKERRRFDSKVLIKKMTEVIEASDLIFEISGEKHSTPDIQNDYAFSGKRERSLTKIINESNIAK